MFKKKDTELRLHQSIYYINRNSSKCVSTMNFISYLIPRCLFEFDCSNYDQLNSDISLIIKNHVNDIEENLRILKRIRREIRRKQNKIKSKVN